MGRARPREVRHARFVTGRVATGAGVCNAPPMATLRLLSVCGSLKAGSSNHALLERLPGLAEPGVVLSAFEGLRDLPPFDEDANEGAPPHGVAAWREALAAADGVFIACPEYGHSLPGALKNAIDWVFGSGELYRKPVVITAASAGPGRGLRGLAALAQTLNALEAMVLGGEPIPRGPGLDEAARRLLAQLVAAARHAREAREAGEPVSDPPGSELPAPIDALVRGTWLRPLLLTRLWQGRDTAAAPPSGADVDGSVRALSELLALSLGVAPPGGPALVLARLDGVLASDDAALGRALLEALIARVDASPTLATALSELGPHALAQLG